MCAGDYIGSLRASVQRCAELEVVFGSGLGRGDTAVEEHTVGDIEEAVYKDVEEGEVGSEAFCGE